MSTKKILLEAIRITNSLSNDIAFMCETRIKETYFTRVGNNKSKKLISKIIYKKCLKLNLQI